MKHISLLLALSYSSLPALGMGSDVQKDIPMNFAASSSVQHEQENKKRLSESDAPSSDELSLAPSPSKSQKVLNDPKTDFIKARELLDKGDTAQSVKLLHTLADQKYAPALTALSLCYLKGVGVSKDRVHAKDLLEQATQLGDAKATREFALLLLNGADGVIEKDQTRAIALLEKAAQMGDAIANKKLAYLNWASVKGILEHNKKNAKDFLQKAAQLGDIEAIEFLASLLWSGFDRVFEKNQKRAKDLWEQAASKGSESAKSNLKRFFPVASSSSTN